MKYVVLLAVVLLAGSGCRKTVAQHQLNALMELITNGQWQVTSFKQNNNDITAHFAAYLFQFRANGNVEALKGGAVEKTGTWVGNATDRTIQSNFGTAPTPLSLLNGTWQITKTSPSFVEALQHLSAEQRTLRLDKK